MCVFDAVDEYYSSVGGMDYAGPERVAGIASYCQFRCAD